MSRNVVGKVVFNCYLLMFSYVTKWKLNKSYMTLGKFVFSPISETTINGNVLMSNGRGAEDESVVNLPFQTVSSHNFCHTQYQQWNETPKIASRGRLFKWVCPFPFRL